MNLKKQTDKRSKRGVENTIKRFIKPKTIIY